jgi:hypothetical protein
MISFFKKKKKEPSNIEEILEGFNRLQENFDSLLSEFEKMKEENKLSIQKVGIVRFNPFSDVGGNQSFSIALLNKENDGLVITSFYTREGNRVYSKPIKKGASRYPLSKEEAKAIKKAGAVIDKKEK